MQLIPIVDQFAMSVEDTDLSNSLAKTELAAIQSLLDQHGVVIFRDQKLDDEAQVAFSEQLGTLEVPLDFDQYAGVHPAITRLSNVGDDDRVMAPDSRHATYMKGNQLWHTDSSFKAVPAKYSLLHGREVPMQGGETEFADCRRALEDWDKESRIPGIAELEVLRCEHSIIFSRSLIIGDFFTDEEKAQFPNVEQPLVRRHPATGAKNFYAGAHAATIVGWSKADSRELIEAINEYCTRPQYRYAHQWRVGDLVIWDNRRVLHRGKPHDPAERRVMHRTTVRDL
jgi:alpha-ketoglutarate-dependent 2,4-dichlorophenoxyacetate dioxygenase